MAGQSMQQVNQTMRNFSLVEGALESSDEEDGEYEPPKKTPTQPRGLPAPMVTRSQRKRALQESDDDQD